jgi:hypothetical protein
MPGIYEPTAYLKGLDQFRLLANYVDQKGKGRGPIRKDRNLKRDPLWLPPILW